MAHETFTFEGAVTGLSASHAPQMSGSLTETMTYNDGVARSCTSTKLSWRDTRDTQPSPQPTTAPPSGSYSGDYFVGGSAGGLTFYVAPGGTAIQDVSANVGMTCSPGGHTPGEWLVIDSLPLPVSRTFGVTTTRTGDYLGNVAHETITFEGHVHGLNSNGVPRLAGSLTETMSYSANGTTFICTSNELPWTATRNTQPSPQPTTAPPSGSYSGDYFVGGSAGGLTFYVAPGGTAIQDVSANVGMTCSPGGHTPGEWLVIDSLPLPVSRTFGVTTTRTGDYLGNVAHETFTFEGHVHGLNSNGVPRLAGSLTETMSYSANGTTFICTSNELPWTATRNTQPSPQPTTAPPSGSYSGDYFVGGSAGGLTFSVAASRNAIQNVSANVGMTCSPNGAELGLPFAVGSLALPANGTFGAISASSAQYEGNRVSVVVVFRGHVHGLDSNGVPRMAGSLIETATYSAGGTVHNCTSGELPWYAIK